MKKNINQIISSELTFRTNNFKLEQEHGIVGSSSNIAEGFEDTKFTTKYSIEQISFITLNGDTLIKDVHYKIVDKNVISIYKNGKAFKFNPSIENVILVSYYIGKRNNVLQEVYEDADIFFFQFSTPQKDLSNIDEIDVDYLENDATLIKESAMLKGRLVTSSFVGRIGFAVVSSVLDKYIIKDSLGNDVTETSFDSAYDGNNNLLYYVSKEYYAPGDMYFKFEIK